MRAEFPCVVSGQPTAEMMTFLAVGPGETLAKLLALAWGDLNHKESKTYTKVTRGIPLSPGALRNIVGSGVT